MTTGELLRAWRQKAALTQEELSEAGDLRSRSYINDYEHDRASPTVRTLLRFISAIEQGYESLGKTDQERLARFFLGPSVSGTLIVAQQTIRLGGRKR